MLTNPLESRPFDHDALTRLLDQLGVPLPELARHLANRHPVPTFAEYVPVVSAAVGKGSQRAYSTYWNRILAHWGDRRLDEPTVTDIERLVQHTLDNVVLRRNARGGTSAAEHLISALRCIYNHAIADGHLTTNPARQVAKPHHRPTTRHALSATQLTAITNVVATTGNDPQLDSLIFRLHTETACRRGGALTLRPTDLDPDNLLIHLHEKRHTERWQPVSPTLMRHLLHHATQRHSHPEHRLLRRSDGTPITHRRYDNLWDRVGNHLPWAAKLNISTHWLRHTTLTWVERNFGYATAQAYAGHKPNRQHGTTTIYTRAGLPDIATALAALTGEPHPLAPTHRPIP